jgi:hypothetical protein
MAKTFDQLRTDINAAFPDVGPSRITPADLRGRMIDVVDATELMANKGKSFSRRIALGILGQSNEMGATQKSTYDKTPVVFNMPTLALTENRAALSGAGSGSMFSLVAEKLAANDGIDVVLKNGSLGGASMVTDFCGVALLRKNNSSYFQARLSEVSGDLGYKGDFIVETATSGGGGRLWRCKVGNKKYAFINTTIPFTINGVVYYNINSVVTDAQTKKSGSTSVLSNMATKTTVGDTVIDGDITWELVSLNTLYLTETLSSSNDCNIAGHLDLHFDPFYACERLKNSIVADAALSPRLNTPSIGSSVSIQLITPTIFTEIKANGHGQSISNRITLSGLNGSASYLNGKTAWIKDVIDENNFTLALDTSSKNFSDVTTGSFIPKGNPPSARYVFIQNAQSDVGKNGSIYGGALQKLYLYFQYANEIVVIYGLSCFNPHSTKSDYDVLETVMSNSGIDSAPDYDSYTSYPSLAAFVGSNFGARGVPNVLADTIANGAFKRANKYYIVPSLYRSMGLIPVGSDLLYNQGGNTEVHLSEKGAIAAAELIYPVLRDIILDNTKI